MDIVDEIMKDRARVEERTELIPALAPPAVRISSPARCCCVHRSMSPDQSPLSSNNHYNTNTQAHSDCAKIGRAHV